MKTKIKETLLKVVKHLKKAGTTFGMFLMKNPIIPIAFVGMLFKNLMFQAYTLGLGNRVPNIGEGFARGISGLPMNVIVLLMLLSPVLLMKTKKGRTSYTLTVHGLFTVLTLVDIGYYREFPELPSVSMLKVATTAASDGYLTLDAITETLSPYDLLLFVDYLFIIGVFVFEQIQKNRIRKAEQHEKAESLAATKEVPAVACSAIGGTVAAIPTTEDTAPLQQPLSEEQSLENPEGPEEIKTEAIQTDSPVEESTAEPVPSKEHKKEPAHPPFLKRFTRFATLLLVCTLLITALPIFHSFGLFVSTYRDIYVPAFPHEKALYFTPLGYHIADIFGTVTDAVFPSGKSELSDAELEQIQAFYQYNNENLPDNEFAGLYKGKNLVLIQVESLEPFMLQESINGMEVTPTLNRLLSQNSSYLYFSELYDQVKSGNSCDCDLMVNTSLLPTSDIFFNSHNDKAVFSMPVALREEGYKTFYVNGCGWDRTWPYEKVYLNAFGYTDQSDPENGNYFMIAPEDGRSAIYRFTADEDTLRFTVDTLKKNVSEEDKFFSHTVLCTSHMPFNYSGDSRYPDLPEEEKVFKFENQSLNDSHTVAYLNEVHYVDKQIGMFLDEMEKAGLLENTVVAIYGDHAGVHKYYATEAKPLGNKYDELSFLNKTDSKMIPLIVYDPSGKTDSKTVSATGGQVDIMPTLMYLLGMDKNSYRYAMGRVLLNTNRNYTILPDGTVVGTDAPNKGSKEYEILRRIYMTSNIMLENDYFKDKIPSNAITENSKE